MSTLAVVVTTPPYSNLTVTAIDYVKNAITMGVNVTGVFFYQDGVLNANKLIAISSDEFQAVNEWENIHKTYNLPLHLCATAAEKRGVIVDDDTMTKQIVSSYFTVSGLGELVELSSKSDKLVQF